MACGGAAAAERCSGPGGGGNGVRVSLPDVFSYLSHPRTPSAVGCRSTAAIEAGGARGDALGRIGSPAVGCRAKYQMGHTSRAATRCARAKMGFWAASFEN